MGFERSVDKDLQYPNHNAFIKQEREPIFRPKRQEGQQIIHPATGGYLAMLEKNNEVLKNGN